MPLDPPTVSERHVVRGACPHDCPDTCALLTTVENGRAIAIRGAPDHPATGGVLCTKVARYLDRTYSDQRVLYPQRRVGSKGEGRFERISWDEALDTIAGRFEAIVASPAGPQAILPYSYAGTMGLLQYASFTASARRCSTARSAHRQARPAGPRPSAPRWGWMSSNTRTAS
jgi:anaerobic selenocysteine-containing dehydrogenase